MKFLVKFVMAALFVIETIILLLCSALVCSPVLNWDNYIVFLVASFSFYLYIIAVTNVMRLK